MPHQNHKFASAPLWVWNADVSKEMISSMLKDFKDNGFGGVFIHPRAGLITPYASKEWFDLCAFALQEAKKLDLDVWIYDENSYPSGFAGGHVPDVMPESYNQGQMLELQKVNVFPDSGAEYFIALKKAGVNAELHIYNSGGHGFGVRPDRPGLAISGWPDRLVAWLADRGWMKK